MARKRTLAVIAAVSLVLGLAAGVAVGATVYATSTTYGIYRADHGHVIAWIDNTEDEARARIHRHTSSHGYVSSPKNYLELRVLIEAAGITCANSGTSRNTSTVNYMTKRVTWPGTNKCPAGRYRARADGGFYDPSFSSNYWRDNVITSLLQMP